MTLPTLDLKTIGVLNLKQPIFPGKLLLYNIIQFYTLPQFFILSILTKHFVAACAKVCIYSAAKAFCTTRGIHYR